MLFSLPPLYSSSSSKPKSLLEIQLEQAVDFPVPREMAAVAPQTRKSKVCSWLSAVESSETLTHAISI